MPRRSRLRLVAVAFVATSSLVAVGCSSSGGSSGTSSSTKAPEEIRVPDAQVTAGLAAMATLFTRAAAAVASGESASSYPADIENQWKKIEGTVKQNEPDLYLQVEEALSSIDNAVKDEKAGDASTAATDFAAASAAYLKVHP